MPCGSGRRNVGQELEAPGFTLVTPDDKHTFRGEAASRLTDCSHTFACFPRQWGGSLRSKSNERRGAAFMLAEIDRFCAQIAVAICASELQLYATIAFIVVLSALLFPPKDDPDQV
jgi:hypothetical protein